MRVSVVGAGISGLGAALALQDAGCQVLVLEREGHVGGRMITRSEQGFTWDGMRFSGPPAGTGAGVSRTSPAGGIHPCHSLPPP